MRRLACLILGLVLIPYVACAQGLGEDDDGDGMKDFNEFVAGTDPTNTTSVFKFTSMALDPETFIVTLGIGAPAEGRQYGLLSHHGPPASNSTWHVVGTQLGGRDEITFVDDVTSSLTHSGITYRAFVSLGPVAPGTVVTSLESMVTSVNEEFIAYPFLTNPVVTVESADTSDELLITYGEGLYSNQVPCTLPQTQAFGFFRMYSTNNDPVNAVIQMNTDLKGGVWSKLPDP